MTKQWHNGQNETDSPTTELIGVYEPEYSSNDEPLGTLYLTFRYIWMHLDTFGYIWIHLDTFGYIWIHLDAFGYIWIHLDTFRYIWIHLDTFGYI